MVRVEDGLPIKPLPMIIPEIRSPPVAEAPQDPVAEAPVQQAPVQQAPVQQAPVQQTAAEARRAARKDPITAILEGILGGGN